MKYSYKFLIHSVWILACLILFHFLYQHTKEMAIADLNERQMIHAKQAVKGIDGYFDHYITVLTSTASRDPIISIDDEGKSLLESLLSYHEPDVKAITRVAEDGRIIHTFPYDSTLIGRDLSGQKHIVELKRIHQPLLSSVFTSVQGFRAIALYVPVFEGDSFKGGLGLLLDFEAISKRFLQDIVIGKTGYAWVIDKDGFELYCPVPGHTGRSVFENCKDFPMILTMAGEMIKGRQGVTTYLFDRVRGDDSKPVKKHAVYLPVRIANTFWSIVVATSEEEVLASLKYFRNEFIGVIAVLLLGSLLFSYYAMKSWGIVKEEKKRRLSEDRFKAHYHGNPVPTFTWQKDGQDYVLMDYNHAAEKVTEGKVKDFVGRKASELYESRGDIVEHFHRCLAEKGVIRRETRSEHFIPGRIIMETSSFVPPNLVVGYLEDITERKRAEEELRASEEKFKAAFEGSHDAVTITTRDGKFLDCNQKALEMFGLADKEGFCEKRPADFSPEFQADGRRSHESALEYVNRAIRERFSHFEWLHQRSSGEIFPAEITLTSYQLRGETVLQATIREISDRKRAEEEREKLQAQLIQAQKMESVGRLAGGVAHDFNNMLGIIIGNTELAAHQCDPADPVHPRLQEILKASNRSAETVRQLLAFARKQTISPKVLDMNDTVSGMLKMLRRLIGEDIDLAWVPGHGLWNVNIDPSQVNQILANLAVNARDAIAGVGKVTIETSNVAFDETYCAANEGYLPGEYVLLGVSDNGTGMDQEILEHLFEPFFTTKGVGKGTGLGLSTIYGIVKQNSGFVKVSTVPGQGSSFKIYFPRFESGLLEDRVEEEDGKLPGGTETVLLVEDEGAILRIGKAMLEELGYKVLTATTPGEAIRVTEESGGVVNLLLTDVVMPETNGRELADRLKGANPALKCLYMSGYTADVIAHHGVLEEGVIFIQKPFSMRELAFKVRETLDR